jgi:SAM-dependent methyltransferase
MATGPSALEALRARLRKILAVTQVMNWLRPYRSPTRKPQGPAGIRDEGHRQYVGGLWNEIGRLQFDFLVERGLQPHHYLLDIACGSLRAGVHFIPYLETGHYLGIDKEEDLIEAGLRYELPPQVVNEKQPRFVVSSEFEVDRFEVRPDFALAHSLFTHLPAEMIERCLVRLRAVIREDGVLFATFFQARVRQSNASALPGHGQFLYTEAEMRRFGTKGGWTMLYVGGWGHPRGQIMVEYHPA